MCLKPIDMFRATQSISTTGPKERLVAVALIAHELPRTETQEIQSGYTTNVADTVNTPSE